MKRFLQHHHFYIGGALLLIIAMILLMFGVGKSKTDTRITASVDSGPVRQMVSVSGITEAKNDATLSFPSAGIVESVLVDIGDSVEAGDILATLDSATLMADRKDAVAGITKANADKMELLAGPQDESRVVTSETVALKERALTTTKETEANKVENALNQLRSTGLTAYSNDADEDAIAPVVSGTFTCKAEGTYKIEVYSSNSESGYSYRLSGLENGSYTASTLQAVPLGDCGLRVMFDADSRYSNTTWYIDVPNKLSETYIAYKNAYELAKTQAEASITLAEQDLALAKATASSNNAPARSEALTRANASITQAEARLARIDSQIAERVLRAPFAGIVTDLDITTGEVAASEPLITLMANTAYSVTARIPEIDISKLALDQKVEMLFDAKSDEIVTGTISFISLKPILIDGVSSFEAYIALDTAHEWMRSGLNADINIIVSETTDTLRLPKRFVTKTDSGYVVLLRSGETVATTSISVTLEGNDGFVAITGLNAGDVIVAP